MSAPERDAPSLTVAFQWEAGRLLLSLTSGGLRVELSHQVGQGWRTSPSSTPVFKFPFEHLVSALTPLAGEAQAFLWVEEVEDLVRSTRLEVALSWPGGELTDSEVEAELNAGLALRSVELSPVR